VTMEDPKDAVDAVREVDNDKDLRNILNWGLHYLPHLICMLYMYIMCGNYHDIKLIPYVNISSTIYVYPKKIPILYLLF
jgi:hypothetical protein